MTQFFEAFPIGFSHPQWLWLLAVIPLFWLLEKKSLVLLGEKRRRMALISRTAIFLLITLALAGMRLERPSDNLSVLFAIDKSESVPEEEIRRAVEMVNTAIGTKRTRDSAGVIVFADEALVEQAPTPTARIESLDSSPGRGFTDISKALRLAVGLFPEGAQRRLVLFSDGNENLGQVLSDAKFAAANDVVVDVVPLNTSAEEEVLIESITSPPKVDKKKPFDVKITVRATKAGRAKLRLYKDRQFAGENEVELAEGKNIFLFPQAEEDAGFHTYEAMIDTLDDTVRDNNQAGAFTLIHGEPRVLLAGAEEDTRYLLEALQLENIPVEIRPSVPSNAADAENFDAIFLCNLSAEGLTDGQLRMLQAYCGDLGGGLAMIGGEDSYGLGGYHKTPVEEALPVSMEIRNKKNFLSLGLMVLIDKSGSMGGLAQGGKSKLEIAAEAAVASSELLTPRDHIGVIGFDSAAKWDVPFQPAVDKKKIADHIRSLRPGGGTDALPAFNEAIRTFSEVKLQLKHIIFISDGMVMPGDYERIVRDLNNLSVTVTTVGIGEDTDREFMEKLAKSTGGRFYFTRDPSNVPRIFTKETVIAQRSYLIEENFTPELFRRNDVVKGLESWPQLSGYVVTEEKDRAEIAVKSHRGDPLLAMWRYRSGKSLAWTSDAKNRWAAEWLGWNDFKKFWGQGTRWVLRNRKESVVQPRLVVESGTGKIIAEAIGEDGKFVNFLNLEAAVLTPDFETRRVPLRQTAPGQYEAEFDAKQLGTYIGSISGDGVNPATAGASVSYPEEYKSLKTNHLLLSEVASATGGRVNPAPADFFRLDGQRVQSVHELWYHFLWLGLLVFLADIGIRRLFLDEEQKQQIAAWFGRLIPRFPARRRAEAAAATLSALRARRAQVQRKRSVEEKTIRPLPKVRTSEPKPGTMPTPLQTPAQDKGTIPAERKEKAKLPDSETQRTTEESSHTARLLQARQQARKRTDRRE